MAFKTIEKAKLYNTAYCPKFKVYVAIIDVWINLNDQTVYLCEPDKDKDKDKGFDGWFGKKTFIGTELTKFCL